MNTEVCKKLTETLTKMGWSTEMILRACDAEFLASMRAVLEQRAVVAYKEFKRINVDYSQGWNEMITAAGFAWVSPKISTAKFSLAGSGVMEFETTEFWFNWNISSKKAIREIQNADPEHPWQPARAEHGVAYGRMYPEQQLKYPIICLGSTVEVGNRLHVVRLYRGGTDPFLFVYANDWDGGWNQFCRFLAVRTVKKLPSP